MKCGYITILGRPNAGKSTLINKFVGQKIAGVSRKPQTTRNKILGVLTKQTDQFIFLDTPGLHKTKGTKLNRMMNQVANASVSDADVLVYLIDPTNDLDDLDQVFLKSIFEKSNQPIFIGLTKRDKVGKKQIIQCLASTQAFMDSLEKESSEKRRFIKIMPISAKISSDTDEVLKTISALLPEGPWLFEDDDMTDRSEKFICSELIREQVFRSLGQEIPYGCAVMVDDIKYGDDLVTVLAKIMVSRFNHKGMVIGKGAQTIKKIGAVSRTVLENHFGSKVYLDLKVQVAKGWIDDENLIKELSYMSELDEVTL